MTAPSAPACAPYRLTTDTWLIPRLAPAGPEGFVYLNSLLIRGEQPVLVETGAAMHRDEWQRDVFSLVDPEDVRWVFVSHDDVDHSGNLDLVLDTCPNATVITDFLGFMRLSILVGLPPHRARWLNPGEALDVGDRMLTAFRPPLFDSACTRGVVDHRTGVLWAVDCFAGPTPDARYDAADISGWREAFVPFNGMENPWLAWLDPQVFGAHVDAVRSLPASVAASCHGPVLRGELLDEAFTMVRGMAGVPVAAAPGQPMLDQIVAEAMTAADTGPAASTDAPQGSGQRAP